MKKLNKIAALFATAALATAAVAQTPAPAAARPAPAAAPAAPAAAPAAPAAAPAPAPTVQNWRAADNTAWRAGASELCWRSGNWTPATAATGCDGSFSPTPPPPPEPPRRAAAAAAAAAAAPARAAAAPAAAPVAAAAKVTFAADAFFDFDRAVLKPAGRASLDSLAEKIRGVNLEVVIAVGHTDSVGSEAYNQRLSERRAAAVKAYLVTKGIDASRIYTEGKGEAQPVADNRTSAGRAQNRRVEIEVVGTRRAN